MANQYFKINYPPNLKAMITDFLQSCYSQGWYGTCSYAPPALQIDCYDDIEGFCLAQFPAGAKSIPSGMQDGTTLTPLTQTEYEKLLNDKRAKVTSTTKGVYVDSLLANRQWNYQPPDPMVEQQYNEALDKVLNG